MSFDAFLVAGAILCVIIVAVCAVAKMEGPR